VLKEVVGVGEEIFVSKEKLVETWNWDINFDGIFSDSIWVTLWLVTLVNHNVTNVQKNKIILWKKEKKVICDIVVDQCHPCHPSAILYFHLKKLMTWYRILKKLVIPLCIKSLGISCFHQRYHYLFGDYCIIVFKLKII